MKFKFTSKQALLICIGAFIVFNAVYRFRDHRMTPILTWDVFGYYLYLPSFFYDDPARLNNFDHLLQTYNPGGNYQAWKAPNGNYIMKYSCGQAIMYLPAFACAHIAAKIFDYPADGLSFPYQAAINFESLIVGCIGLWLLRKILKKYFADHVVAIVLIIVALASNYFQYVAFDNGFTHNYLFTLYCIIILLSIQWHSSPRYSTSIAIGFCCGLAALTRPTEIITALIPLLWGIYDRTSISKRILVLKKKWKMIVCFCITAFFIGSIQLVYWKVYAGSWLYFSYGADQSFTWLHPHLRDVLFSYKKGWLIYTPVMILSIVGLILLIKNHREQFWFVLIFMLVFLYLVAAWDVWWYGGSFSMRAMIQSYPVLAFSLAACIEFLLTKKIFAIITSLFVVACIWLNGIMSYQVFFSSQGIFNGDGMTGRYYWRIFGKTHISINDKKLMDTYEELPTSLEKKLTPVYSNDIEQLNEGIDSTTAFSGKRSMILNSMIQATPVISVPVNGNDKCWYRVSAEVFAPAMEWDVWRHAKLRAELWNNDTLVRERSIRIYRIIETGKWQEIFIDLDGYINKPYNLLKVKFTNEGGNETIFIDDIQIRKVAGE